MMAMRVTGRDGVVVARTVHPEYREVMHTYAQHREVSSGVAAVAVGYGEDGRIDLAALDAAVTDETACVMVQSPNFFGVIEDVAAIAAIAQKKGALLVVAVAEAVSLGIVRPPVEADIVIMEAQSYGVAPSYGGPFCGVIAAKEKYVRQMPGRLVGQTTDKQGRRGFVLTLSTREQHIRREKATSNICTNQALVALMATVFMTVYGKAGNRELALQNLAKADYAAKTLGAQGTLLFGRAPRFNEFVLETEEAPRSAECAAAGAEDHRRACALKKWYPELGNATLWCATELTSKAQMMRQLVLAGTEASARFTHMMEIEMARKQMAANATDRREVLAGWRRARLRRT